MARRYARTVLILSLLALLLGLPLGVLIAVSSHQPLIQTPAAITPQDAHRLKRIFRQMEFAGYFNRPQRLLISSADINSLFALARRGLKRLSGTAQISPQQGTVLRVAIHVPENPFGDYINLSLGLPRNSHGMALDFFRIGNIEMDGDQALWLFKQLADLLLGRRHSDMLLNSVQGIDTRADHLLIDYRPIPDLKQQLAALLKHAPLLNETTQPEDRAAIRVYYRQLCQALNRDHRPTLAPYLSQAFKLARSRSHDARQAMAENRAALLAITLLFGHPRFNQVIEAVPVHELDSCQQRGAAATLQGRVDFREHFVYSIFLKLMSDRDITLAMAEFKELSDTLRGGSGFNFADLAADQAGIRFAEYATHPDSARRLQQRAALLRDSDHFFPAMEQLAQGLSEQRFKQQFGGVDSKRYRQLQAEIEARLDGLALYQTERAGTQ